MDDPQSVQSLPGKPHTDAAIKYAISYIERLNNEYKDDYGIPNKGHLRRVVRQS